MTNRVPQLLYILNEDLYRLGNATSPKLHNVRADDVDTYERNGIVMVRANGKGISLIMEDRLERIKKIATGVCVEASEQFSAHGWLGDQSRSEVGSTSKRIAGSLLSMSDSRRGSKRVCRLVIEVGPPTGKDAKAMIIELDEWRARYLLEALRVCQDQWSATAKASEDEDLQAEFGNDLVRLSILYDTIQGKAVEAFGSKIEDFSRAPVSLTVPNTRDNS